MPEADVLAAAIDPPRAFGRPIGTARIRTEPEDFIIDEELGFGPDGEGPHVLLRVRKRCANTAWVARELARAARCREHDVGYAGLKDRHAVATQWFSIPAGRRPCSEWPGFGGEGFVVLEAHPHRRKLPRGALAANRFAIRVRSLEVDRGALRERLELVRTHGVPNYFGVQRFGRGAANLDRLNAVAQLRRHERSFVLSAARSLVFNAVLAERVSDGTWQRLEPGDIAILDGRGSIFAVDAVQAAIAERASRLEVHPTGPLWGVGAPTTAGRVRALEVATAARFPAACEASSAAGMAQERRSLRLNVRDLEYDLQNEPVIAFRLTRGAFATCVLRELLDCADGHSGGEEGA
ncbi:MAG: tRNA pseudouridine(13) synthase TruD [Gammaproteobacteria bacterium]